ncbi:inositol monophosphatase (plasmid) [Tistrella bauzanensis]|jgi:myo-inositol-1(or 4)-monophosphatase|uniref:inositol monophosphatase family protein n=1 Tax=Tistrella TaxID=171436 RepID=UPI0031F6B031
MTERPLAMTDRPLATTGQSLDTSLLRDIEMLAVELAEQAGAAITSRLGSLLSVRYKTGAETEATLRNPVSEVDEQVEGVIRERLAARFPEHGVIGEEMADSHDTDLDMIWAVDPVDGTSNFINGFPLFAASIGVLHRGRPVVAAVWCATSHALRSGVYHARLGGGLHFDRQPLARASNPMVHRRLAGVPQFRGGRHPYDLRKTGSAAIECAFVAAGLLEAASFNSPNIWDVAGGILLVQESGGQVLTRGRGKRWQPFEGFVATPLRDWRGGLILGSADGAGWMAGNPGVAGQDEPA